MSSFFSLPIEIRFQIYRELRSFKSPLIKSPMPNEHNAFGYCSFGFKSRILETNHQICAEAKEVFYGQNYWTFFASQRNHFSHQLFTIKPMLLVLPFIRKAHIRFSMFHWLLWESRGNFQSATGDMIKDNVKEICQLLLVAPNLRTVKIIWTETHTLRPARLRKPQYSVRELILEVLRPLISLSTTTELQKSIIMVAYRNGVKASEMELDFSESVDYVIAMHRSLKDTVSHRMC